MVRYAAIAGILLLAACTTVEEIAGITPASPTAPYTTDDYDATTLLPCSLGDASNDQSCPAGIRRGDTGFATITTTRPDGFERIMDFTPETISTPGSGTLTSRKDGDTWYISIDDNEHYVVPEAAIFGG